LTFVLWLYIQKHSCKISPFTFQQKRASSCLRFSIWLFTILMGIDRDWHSIFRRWFLMTPSLPPSLYLAVFLSHFLSQSMSVSFFFPSNTYKLYLCFFILSLYSVFYLVFHISSFRCLFILSILSSSNSLFYIYVCLSLRLSISSSGNENHFTTGESSSWQQKF
jgi:hypothetical protein